MQLQQTITNNTPATIQTIVHLRQQLIQALTHTGEEPDFKASAKRKLVIHQNTHIDTKPFACELCHYKANTKSPLTLGLNPLHPLNVFFVILKQQPREP